MRTKTKYDASSPTSLENDHCIKNIAVDVTASKEEEFTAVVGEILTVQIAEVNITQESTDAITNAANEDLCHGMGVAHAIAKASGP